MCALAQPCTQAIPCFSTHLHYMHNTGTCIVNPLSSKEGTTPKFSLLLGFWPAHCLAMSVCTCSASYPGHPIFLQRCLGTRLHIIIMLTLRLWSFKRLSTGSLVCSLATKTTSTSIFTIIFYHLSELTTDFDTLQTRSRHPSQCTVRTTHSPLSSSHTSCRCQEEK